MRIVGAAGAAILAAAGALAAEQGRPTALLVSPIHDAQVVRGDDGMDHVEYGLLVVSVFAEPVTLTRVAVLDPAGAELMRLEGAALAATTQTLFDKAASPVVPASAAVAVDIDLALPPGTAPQRVTHRIEYALAPDTQSAAMIDRPEIDGPEVAVDRRPARMIAPPLRGSGWLVTAACCGPNVHRDLRVAIDGRRIATAETFAVDWALVRDGRIFDGDGSRNEDHYAFGAEVLAVADGTVVSAQDGKPEAPPGAPIPAETASDYGGNHVLLQIGPEAFAAYGHLRNGSVLVGPGDAVKAGEPLARLGNTGPSTGPHLHFGLLDAPDLWSGESLPFVFERFTVTGRVDLDVSEGDRLVIAPERREVERAYPLLGGINDYP